MAIVATAGTTDFGSIDPLPELAALAHAAGAWLHVDAAYGGALLFSDRHRDKLHGIETADSLSIDFHKLFWQPIPCSVFLLRDARHFDSIKLHADYLNPELHEDEGIPNLVTTSLLTSRRFDALKLWISFQTLGRAKLAAMIDRTIELAAHAARVIRKSPQLELMCEPQLSTVVFRYVPSTQNRCRSAQRRSPPAPVRSRPRGHRPHARAQPAMPEVHLHESGGYRRSNGSADSHRGGDRRGARVNVEIDDQVSLSLLSFRPRDLQHCTYMAVNNVPAGTLFPQAGRYAPTGFALTVGSLACCQASNPPTTLITFLKPARCSRLQAIMLRYPPLQCTAMGAS